MFSNVSLEGNICPAAETSQLPPREQGALKYYKVQSGSEEISSNNKRQSNIIYSNEGSWF